MSRPSATETSSTDRAIASTSERSSSEKKGSWARRSASMTPGRLSGMRGLAQEPQDRGHEGPSLLEEETVRGFPIDAQPRMRNRLGEMAVVGQREQLVPGAAAHQHRLLEAAQRATGRVLAQQPRRRGI